MVIVNKDIVNKDIVNSLAELPLLVPGSRREVFQSIRALQEQARHLLDAQGHPEDFCKQCHRPNVVWFAPNELWNKAVREQGLPEVLCPVCFIQAAEKAGAFTAVWKVAPQDWRDTEQVIRLREALEPHKAINFLTALEHQAHRNHEYHPDQCAECSLTQTIAERLRDELGLTTVRRTTTKG